MEQKVGLEDGLAQRDQDRSGPTQPPSLTYTDQRYSADWADRKHHGKRLVCEFIGTFGFVFSLSGGAGAFHAFAKPPLSTGITVTLLTMVASMWLVIAIYAFGDISAHFNPSMTFAFALRGDITWRRTLLYWLFQCAGAAAGSFLARAFFGPSSGLASVHPQPGKNWQAVGFEVLLTASFVLMVLVMARGPKLNGPFTPLAVAAYVLSFATFGGLYEGAAFNPARAFGPALAIGHLGDLWIYILGAAGGATIAVGIDRYLRGPLHKPDQAAGAAPSAKPSQ